MLSIIKGAAKAGPRDTTVSTTFLRMTCCNHAIKTHDRKTREMAVLFPSRGKTPWIEATVRSPAVSSVTPSNRLPTGSQEIWKIAYCQTHMQGKPFFLSIVVSIRMAHLARSKSLFSESRALE